MSAMAKPTGPSTGTATKTKKPSVSISTNSNAKAGLASSSPSSAAKRLPGPVQTQATGHPNTPTTNGVARPSRRLQRLSTRMSTAENLSADKKPTWTAEPYVITEAHILKKYKGKTPSLIVHLHPTYFRFDQQDGSFSYNSEMRVFIKHLKDGTIPHDMLEELRLCNVRFYENWLIVKVVDHKSLAADAAATNGTADDEKPFSIHNYNHFVTPSPFVPYPSKDQMVKMERSASTDKENQAPDAAATDATQRSAKSKPRVFFKALRPTSQSRATDLMLDCIAPDPKARKPPNKAGQPPTPVGPVPPTPPTERPPPLKKQKLRIDPKDHLEYEAKIVNATAPPLYLGPADDLAQMESVHQMLADPLCQDAPPSPKSRKRTVAELAADDAHAKEQERFMLIMDARGAAASGANAASVESQPTAFQPRFERFNALDKIRNDLAEKKRQDAEKRVQEEELRRSQQQLLQDEENRRKAQQAAIAQRKEQAILQNQQKQQLQHLQQQRQTQENMAAQQVQQNAQNAQRRANAAQQQPNGIPPQMQSQMMAAQVSSPVVRQGTPNVASSPAAPNARAMARSGSQAGGAASSPRPGSSLQHGHPAAAAGMMRQPSGQGAPSRNGTPQIPHSTPGMPNATPVMRQGTPAHLPQQSPMVSMAGTPQMNQAHMSGPMVNGMQHPGMAGMNAQQQQQLAAMQRRQQMQQLQQMQQNGQMQGQANAQMMQALANQQAAMRQQQQQQQQGQNAPTPQHMSPAPQQTHPTYNAQLRRMMQQQMPQQGSASPQTQMSPQQMQAMHNMQQQQAATMQNQPGQQQGQAPRPANPQMQQMLNQRAIGYFKQLMVNESQKYGQNPNMIPPQVKARLQAQAQTQALMDMQRSRQMQNQQMGQNAMNGQMMNPQMQQQMQQQMANMNRNMAMQQQHQQQAQNQQAQQMQQMHMQNAAQMIQQGYVSQVMQMQHQQNMHQGQPRPG